MITYDQSAELILNVLEDLGYSLIPEHKILDFGCGSGNLLGAFRSRGLDAYGTDIKPFWENAGSSYMEYMRVIDHPKYHIPYDDNNFDMICSTSVFEHVQDYERSFREIHRVLKPGGCTIHIFPGPWIMPVEPHMYVPLASVIQYKWWFALWALLGIRNEYQRNKSWKEVANLNYIYSQNGINYKSLGYVKKLIMDIFGNIAFPTREYMNHSPGGAARLGRRIRQYIPVPFYDKLLFIFREQIIFSVKNNS